MEHNQTLNSLVSKILIKMDNIYNNYNINNIIVQGDTSTAFGIALSGFHRRINIIHLEAGLRTNNKYSPYPEELNRSFISKIANIHLCPTKISVKNLNKKNINKNVYLVGNTIVDMYNHVNKININDNIKNIINKEYYLVTLHRRENRGDKMINMWNQLNNLSDKYNFIYITHPSLPESKKILNNNIILLEPQFT